MTPTRWYLQRAPSGFYLVVERRDDKRGYRMQMSDRATAKRRLPHLRAMVENLDAIGRAVEMFDPVEFEDTWLDEFGLSDEDVAKIITEALERVARGDLPDVRPVAEGGDTHVDIAASRARDYMARRDGSR